MTAVMTAEKAEAAEREPAGAGEAEAGGGAPRPGRARTCVGCGERVVAAAPGDPLPLVRLILGPGGVIAVDPGDGGFGRGAHVHPRPDCLAKAVQRGLARAAKGRVHAIHADPEGEPAPLTVASLARAIREATDRRIQGLVRAAVRSRAVAIGADATADAIRRGAADLTLVACDAAAGADIREVQQAIAAGQAVAWGTKEALGVLAGGRREQGVAVLAVSSGRIAGALAEAVRVVDACAAVERGGEAAQRPPGGRNRGQARPAEPAALREARNSLQTETPHRMEESGAAIRQGSEPVAERSRGQGPAAPGAAPDVARDGTGPGAAAKRRPRGWARRTR